MPSQAPGLRIHNEFDLQDLVVASARDGSLVERDFALVTIAAGLVAAYENSLCFKGGFVLRHVHGHERFSSDIDATRINPPKHKLDAAAVAATIRGSGMRNLMRLNVRTPETDSGRSLDFDRIDYSGPSGRGVVSVEISYREDVIESPELAAVGEPYYEPFIIPVMTINEIVAEKLRALAQRLRPTDLADVAMILRQRDRRRPRPRPGREEVPAGQQRQSAGPDRGEHRNHGRPVRRLRQRGGPRCAELRRGTQQRPRPPLGPAAVAA